MTGTVTPTDYGWYEFLLSQGPLSSGGTTSMSIGVRNGPIWPQERGKSLLHHRYAGASGEGNGPARVSVGATRP